jgi:hypothetical protein
MVIIHNNRVNRHNNWIIRCSFRFIVSEERMGPLIATYLSTAYSNEYKKQTSIFYHSFSYTHIFIVFICSTYTVAD